MAGICDGLNVAQREAVCSPASVLQVLAPPGSGKTKTLTCRVAHLLMHHEFAPWDIICCTFTIKASREMRERLRGIIGQQRESKLILGTFHSVCVRYLRIYGYLIGIENFGVADSSDSLAIIKRVIKEHNLTIDAKATKTKISHRKARGQRDEKSTDVQRKTIEKQEFATVLQAYEDCLHISNLLDYDDLLLRCHEVLRLYPKCVSNIQAVLIDEFQDTNAVQFELMKLFASKMNRITIVGDPDQSIYGFRSAESANLVRMRAAYPGTVVINLEENYRSSAAILNAAQEVIEQDAERHDKKLRATQGYGTLPVLRILSSAHDEASWIVNEIRRTMAMTGRLLSYTDFAILLRAAHLSRLIESALGKAGIPYRMVGGNRFFDREEIKILLDYLRTISLPTNTAALSAIVNVPSRKIGEEKMKELVRIAEDKKLPLWEVVLGVSKGTIKLRKTLPKAAEQALADLIKIIKDARAKLRDMVPDNVPRELLAFVIGRLSFQKYLKTQHPEDHENRWANVEELLTTTTDIADHQTLSVDTNFDESLPVIEGLVQKKGDAGEEVLARFLASITLSADLESPEVEQQRQQCLTISTIHAAKGLEWPVVFVPAVYEGSIPHSRAEDIDEERRLLYVAMTRAQALLNLSVPLRRSRDDVDAEPSRFVPPQLQTRFSKVGPDYSDNVVSEIAKTLRRLCPSQRDIVDGVQSLTGRESTRDDLWPQDGSPLPRQYWSDGITQAGDQRSEGMLPGFGYKQVEAQPRQGFVAGHIVPTTMNLHRNYSVSSTTLGFTTAGHQLRSNPRDPHFSAAENPTATEREKSRPAERKAKTRADPDQGKLPSFFMRGQSPLRSCPIDHVPDPLPIHQSNDGEPALPPQPFSQKTSQVPQHLSSHKLATNVLPHKRPRPVLEEIVNPNARRYPFLSSSPSRDVEATPLEAAKMADRHLYPIPTKSINLTDAVTMNQSPKIKNLYTSMISQRLMRPASTMHTTSMATVQQAGPARKTLGVRRTMHGWDNRRNK